VQAVAKAIFSTSAGSVVKLLLNFQRVIIRAILSIALFTYCCNPTGIRYTTQRRPPLFCQGGNDPFRWQNDRCFIFNEVYRKRRTL